MHIIIPHFLSPSARVFRDNYILLFNCYMIVSLFHISGLSSGPSSRGPSMPVLPPTLSGTLGVYQPGYGGRDQSDGSSYGGVAGGTVYTGSSSTAAGVYGSLRRRSVKRHVSDMHETRDHGHEWAAWTAIDFLFEQPSCQPELHYSDVKIGWLLTTYFRMLHDVEFD